MASAKTYHDRFIEAVLLLQAKLNLVNLKDISNELGINYMTLYKIMDKTNRPTVDQCITVIMRGGYDANWLFMGKGQKLASENISLKDIKAAILRVEAIVQRK